MIQRILAISALVLFILLVLGIAYSYWQELQLREVSQVSPTPTATPLSTPTPTRRFGTQSDTPTSTDTPVPANTPTSTSSPTPTNTPSLTHTPSSATSPPATQSPTPTATPTIPGVVIVENLNLRSGPSAADTSLHILHENDVVTILYSTINRVWYYVNFGDNDGWVKARFIETDEVAIIPTINPTHTRVPTPTPTLESSPTLTPTSTPSPTATPFIRPGDTFFGELAAGAGHEYVLATLNDISFTLMYRPKVAHHVHFVIRHRNYSNEYEITGVGSPPGNDLDGNQATGELIWDGSSLVTEVEYYIYITNGSPQDIQYCLTAFSADKWSCDNE